MTRAPQLLKTLEPLCFRDRIRHMVALGRRAGTDPEAAEVLKELRQGGMYERQLALQACYGSREGTQVQPFLLDPAASLRRLARILATQCCDEAQLVQALEQLLPREKPLLASLLRHRGRLAAIDSYVLALAEKSEPTLELLLPYASTPVAMDLLPQVAPGAGEVFWKRMARYHPELAVRYLQAHAGRLASPDPRLTWQVRAVFPILSLRAPDQALELLTAVRRWIPLSQFCIQPLAQRRPLKAVACVLQAPEAVSLELGPLVRHLDAETLAVLVNRLNGQRMEVAASLRRVPPARRLALYEALGAGWSSSAQQDGLDGTVEAWILAYLPGQVRLPEAHRHLAMPVLTSRPLERMVYLGLLPWAEALAGLTPYLSSPTPEQRAVAWSALTQAGRYNRDELPALLALAKARRHEQDPVRVALMRGLAALPPGAWRSNHLSDLGQILRDALDAADLSFGTVSEAQKLVAGLFPFHPAWATQWLATLVKERGQLALGSLEDKLTDADVLRILPDLLPVLKVWSAREREAHLLTATQSLGRRLRVCDEVCALVEGMARSSRQSWLVVGALELLKRHASARFRKLVPELLTADPSAITLSPVLEHLHRHRQDLLSPTFLGRRAYKGRFSTGNTRLVLPLVNGFYRWTPGQQATFAKTLEEVIRSNDTARDTPAVLSCLQQLSALHFIPATILENRVDDPRPAVSEGALRALGRLEEGAGAPRLIRALDTPEHARIAIYALRGILLSMPAEKALERLAQVPLQKVTVAKEVVRLLGELPSDVSFGQLQAMEQTNLHRDVRVALLRALWSHLERPETWEMLHRAAVSPDPALSSGLIRMPADRLSPDAQRRMVRLLQVLLEHPDPPTRLAVLQRCAELPVADPDRSLLQRLTNLLGSPVPDERQAAGRAVASMCLETDLPALLSRLEAIRLDRRALSDMVQAITSGLPQDRARLVPVARGVLAALQADPATVAVRSGLLLELPWPEIQAELIRLSASGELQLDGLIRLAQCLRQATRRVDGEGTEDLERFLAGQADERLRWLGLQALQAMAEWKEAWSPERLARLEAYRRDGALLVSAAAQFVLPAQELDPVLPVPAS